MTTTARNPRGSAKCLLGVDLGQAQDPTAIAVAETWEPEIHVRHPCRLAMDYDLKEGRFKSIDYRLP